MPEIFADSPSKSMALDAQRPEIRPNYSSNWLNLQHSRMESADFIEKYSRLFGEHADVIEDFMSRRDAVHGYVEYDTFASFAIANASRLGRGQYGKPGRTYSDASNDGQLITGSQKDIIAAHEAYHGVIDMGSVLFVRDAFDLTRIEAYVKQKPKDVLQVRNWEDEFGQATLRRFFSYYSDPNELTVRMAQLKNYFGMGGAEIFSLDHLNYARQFYISDTGLDNDMTLFFYLITPDKEHIFVRLMNELPV